MTGFDGFNRTMDMLFRALDATAFRHELIANNIANVNTPGYKRKDVVFRDELDRAMNPRAVNNRTSSSTHPNHLAVASSGNEFSRTGITVDDGVSFREDGNNVDIDREMAELAKNSLRYNYLSEALSRQMALVRMAITQGRR